MFSFAPDLDELKTRKIRPQIIVINIQFLGSGAYINNVWKLYFSISLLPSQLYFKVSYKFAKVALHSVRLVRLALTNNMDADKYKFTYESIIRNKISHSPSI